MADFFNNYGGGSGRYGDAIGQAVGQASAAGAQDQIAQMYAQASGGTYTPTQQDLGQWGANPDAQYLQKIGPAIQQWWNQNQGLATGQPSHPGYDPTNPQAQSGDGWSVSAALPSYGMGGPGGYNVGDPQAPSYGPATGQPSHPGYDPQNPNAQRGDGWYVSGALPSYGMAAPSAVYAGGPPARSAAQAGGYLPLAQLARGGAGSGGGGSFYGPTSAAAGGAAGGTVLLRAPNGQTRAVPADQVQYYLARGATRG